MKCHRLAKHGIREILPDSEQQKKSEKKIHSKCTCTKCCRFDLLSVENQKFKFPMQHGKLQERISHLSAFVNKKKSDKAPRANAIDKTN